MKMLISKLMLLTMLGGMLAFHSCKKDPDPVPEPEQEEFDGVRVGLISLDANGLETGDTVAITFNASGAPDGDVTLQNGNSYRMLITLLWQGESLNQEVLDEGTLHQFFFNPSVPGILDYSYGDQDDDGRGIGLDGILSVEGTGTLQLKVILRHGLDKSHPQAQEWNSETYEAAGGEDDLNVSFLLKAA